MARNVNDTRRMGIMALAALWLLAWGWSVVIWLEDLVRNGAIRPQEGTWSQILGWQGIAGMLALALWGIARRDPARAVRRVATLPIMLAVAAALLVWNMG